MNRAGIQADDRKRGEGHEEYILFKVLEVLENFDENDVLCKENVMERLNIFIAVLDGNTIAESYCLPCDRGTTLRTQRRSGVSYQLLCWSAW